MAHENKILHISLFVGLVSLLANGVAYGAVRIGNRTKNDVYRQVVSTNMATYDNQVATTVATAEPELPVRVANENLAKQIQSGTASINAGQLEACSRIYPNGTFAWDKPTAGLGAGGANTCVAVVELRGYQMGPGGSDVVLARANVAAGSNVKCNISDFPENFYTIDAQNVIFPADAEPTVDDVKNVMNQEQKQNAGLKIAAATLVGAIGGNIAGKNDVGKDGLVGTDKGKIQGTVIGALSGAAIGAGGAYAGKVGGDMIMSTGINAAAGGVVGNIMASGDAVLRIEDCKDSDGNTGKCLWGYVIKGDNIKPDEKVYYNISEEMAVSCKGDTCKPDNFAAMKIMFNGEEREINSLKDTEWRELRNGSGVKIYHLEQYSNGKSEMKENLDGPIYIEVVSARHATSRQPALVWGVQDKFFGMKRSDWYNWKTSHQDNKIYARSGRGDAEGEPLTDVTINDFEPMYVDAEDGGIIDLNNKARLKGTMVGAGVGGAAGAFTAYQGAQSDIDERWVSAVREYKDSLQKFYCATGSRFLSYYHDVVIIPNAKE